MRHDRQFSCIQHLRVMTVLTCVSIHLRRQSIFDTLASFGAAWREKQAFAEMLLSSLLADADKSACRASAEPLSAEEQYSLLAYIGCSAAICEACSLRCSSNSIGESAMPQPILYFRDPGYYHRLTDVVSATALTGAWSVIYGSLPSCSRIHLEVKQPHFNQLQELSKGSFCMQALCTASAARQACALRAVARLGHLPAAYPLCSSCVPH